MILRLLPLLSAAALSVPLAGCVARGASRLTNVIPLDLQEGANLVPHLAPDGRQGLVVEARQAWGARLIMTMLPRSEGTRGWDVVELQNDDGSQLPTIDSRGRAVVFARAKVSGMPATLLFVASPDPEDGASPAVPRRMVIQTLRLDVDESSARFAPIGAETTRGRYCTPTDAVAATYRLALPEDPGRDDRCEPPGA